jgi:four helix bundle protein
MRKSITHIKSKAFAVRIIRFYKYLTEEKKEFVLSKQILRSGTSIGANIRESYSAQSKADFIAKLYIALKEANETLYWLELFCESNIINTEEFESLNKDLEELIALLTATIKTSQENK